MIDRAAPLPRLISAHNQAWHRQAAHDHLARHTTHLIFKNTRTSNIFSQPQLSVEIMVIFFSTATALLWSTALAQAPEATLRAPRFRQATASQPGAGRQQGDSQEDARIPIFEHHHQARNLQKVIQYIADDDFNKEAFPLGECEGTFVNQYS